jgi:predicted transcriptional regulator of viral defense system
VVTTHEAAAALKGSTSAASRMLGTLADHGLATHLRHGLWLLGTDPVDPRQLSAEITRPYPSYVSFASALAAHQVIDQIPREITLASLGRAKRVRTALGSFVTHRMPPALFGGFERRDGFSLATVEKAVFDFYYVAAASGHTRQRLPELDLPSSFARKTVERWIGRIRSPRLRTLVRASIERALRHAALAAAG